MKKYFSVSSAFHRTTREVYSNSSLSKMIRKDIFHGMELRSYYVLRGMFWNESLTIVTENIFGESLTGYKWKILFGVSGVWPGLLNAHFVKITIEVLQTIDKTWT
jgi:hypothetical protein